MIEQNGTILDRQPLWTRPFIVITVSYFMLFLCLQMLLAPLPSYAKVQFQPSDFMVSLVTSMFALSAIAARMLTAKLMRKVHRNVLLLAGIIIAAAATACYAVADSFAGLLGLRIGFGIGFGISSTVIPTLVSQLIPTRRMGEGIGYFGLSTSLAMSLGPLIGLSVLDNYGFTFLSFMGSAAAIVMVPLLYGTRSLPPQPQPSHVAISGTNDKLSRMVYLAALLNVLLSVTYGGILSFIALFGKEVGLEHVGLFFLFNVFTIIIVRPISGRLFDTKGHAAVLVPGALSMLASLILLSYSTNVVMLLSAALLYGLGFGAMQPTLQAWMLRDAPKHQHGKVNSYFYNSIDFGVAVGAMLLGGIALLSSYAAMYRFSAVIMVLFLIVYGAVYVQDRKKLVA